MPALEVKAERILKRHVVEHVAAEQLSEAEVLRPITSHLRMERRRERRWVAPRIAEVVLGTGAKPRRARLAIDEQLLVAFAPPDARWIANQQRAAHKPAGALGVEHDVVRERARWLTVDLVVVGPKLQLVVPRTILRPVDPILHHLALHGQLQLDAVKRSIDC